MDTHADGGQRTIVSTANNINRNEWDQFVRTHHDGTFFHLSGWSETARSVYKYDPVYISARRDGDLVGILALTDAKAPVTGRSLVSTAFSVGGGPLADDEETLRCLLETAESIGASRKVDYIELRCNFANDGWQEKSGTHAGFKAPIIADENEALAAIPRKRRAEVRKAIALIKAGDLILEQRRDLDSFYSLYAESLHRLGTPVFPKSFLQTLLEEFQDAAEILTLRYRGAPVASLVNFYHNDTVLPYYVGANDNAREARAFDYLYWITMRRAFARGITHFDFGRSKIESGPFAYKKLWGFKPEPISYRIKPIRAKALPDVSANNPKFAMFVKLWPKIPLTLANRVGPVLAPNFP